MAHSTRCVDAASLMAVIGSGYGITSSKRLAHAGVADRTTEPAAANLQVLQIPPGLRNPHFEIDVRVAGWGREPGHSAELRQSCN